MLRFAVMFLALCSSSTFLRIGVVLAHRNDAQRDTDAWKGSHATVAVGYSGALASSLAEEQPMPIPVKVVVSTLEERKHFQELLMQQCTCLDRLSCRTGGSLVNGSHATVAAGYSGASASSFAQEQPVPHPQTPPETGEIANEATKKDGANAKDAAAWCPINMAGRKACKKLGIDLEWDAESWAYVSKGLCEKPGGSANCKCSGFAIDFLSDPLTRNVELNPSLRQLDRHYGASCEKWNAGDSTAWCFVGYDSACADKKWVSHFPLGYKTHALEQTAQFMSYIPCSAAASRSKDVLTAVSLVLVLVALLF